MGLIIIQDTIQRLPPCFPMNIGYGSLTARTDELNTTPSRNNSLQPENVQGPSRTLKRRGLFPFCTISLGDYGC